MVDFRERDYFSIRPWFPEPKNCRFSDVPLDADQPYRKKKGDGATHLLSPERATLSEAGLATSRLAKHVGAALADDDGLGVRENGRDREATGALDVHEEGAGGGNQGL